MASTIGEEFDLGQVMFSMTTLTSPVLQAQTAKELAPIGEEGFLITQIQRPQLSDSSPDLSQNCKALYMQTSVA